MAGKIEVDGLGLPVTARQVSVSAVSANTALTVGVARISMYAKNSDMRYLIGSSAQTASATTSHYIALGERLDVNVPPSTPNIAVIAASGGSGTLEITELG